MLQTAWDVAELEESSAGVSAGPSAAEPEDGFFLEYVLQASPPAGPGVAPGLGPHVMEVVLKVLINSNLSFRLL